MSAWIWVVIAILAVIVLLFGITNTFGIIAFIILLILLAFALYSMFKNRVKQENGKVTLDTRGYRTPSTF